MKELNKILFYNTPEKGAYIIYKDGSSIKTSKDEAVEVLNQYMIDSDIKDAEALYNKVFYGFVTEAKANEKLQEFIKENKSYTARINQILSEEIKDDEKVVKAEKNVKKKKGLSKLIKGLSLGAAAAIAATGIITFLPKHFQNKKQDVVAETTLNEEELRVAGGGKNNNDVVVESVNETSLNTKSEKINQALTDFNEKFANKFKEKGVKPALSYEEVLTCYYAYNELSIKDIRTILKMDTERSIAFQSNYKASFLQIMGAHIIGTHADHIDLSCLLDTEEGKAFYNKYSNLFYEIKKADNETKKELSKEFIEMINKDFHFNDKCVDDKDSVNTESYKLSVLPMIVAYHKIYKNNKCMAQLNETALKYFNGLGVCNLINVCEEKTVCKGKIGGCDGNYAVEDNKEYKHQNYVATEEDKQIEDRVICTYNTNYVNNEVFVKEKEVIVEKLIEHDNYVKTNKERNISYTNIYQNNINVDIYKPVINTNLVNTNIVNNIDNSITTIDNSITNIDNSKTIIDNNYTNIHNEFKPTTIIENTTITPIIPITPSKPQAEYFVIGEDECFTGEIITVEDKEQITQIETGKTEEVTVHEETEVIETSDRNEAIELTSKEEVEAAEALVDCQIEEENMAAKVQAEAEAKIVAEELQKEADIESALNELEVIKEEIELQEKIDKANEVIENGGSVSESFFGQDEKGENIVDFYDKYVVDPEAEDQELAPYVENITTEKDETFGTELPDPNETGKAFDEAYVDETSSSDDYYDGLLNIFTDETNEENTTEVVEEFSQEEVIENNNTNSYEEVVESTDNYSSEVVEETNSYQEEVVEESNSYQEESNTNNSYEEVSEDDEIDWNSIYESSETLDGEISADELNAIASQIVEDMASGNYVSEEEVSSYSL